MNIPFTTDQFLGIFKTYNQAVFPVQVFFYIIAILVIYLAIKPNKNSDKLISGILAFFWFWMGIVYHLLYFTQINKAAYLFGVVFIVQGIFFLIVGVFKNKLSYRFSSDLYGVSGMILIFYALVIYPVLGFFLGHIYPSSPTFGLPCPTTIFTFGILLFCNKKCPVTILIIPFVWSVVGISAAYNLGIWEDTGLLIAGLVTLILLLIKNRSLSSFAGMQTS